MKVYESPEVSSDGQVTVPMKIRRLLNLKSECENSFRKKTADLVKGGFRF
jgi:bifunctional DNA-binding transcriptional regulator/antitoxin component of YhaV-PrlF toxin-antitoxin module